MLRRWASALVALVAVSMALTLGVSDASAKEADSDFDYAGTGSSSATLFNVRILINGHIHVPLPGHDFGDPVGCVPGSPPFDNDCGFDVDIFPGQLSVRAKLDVVTTATLGVPTHFHVSGPDSIVEGTTVPIISTNVIGDGANKEFKLDGSATLTIHADYDPNENGLECDAYDASSAGNDSCGQLNPSVGPFTLMNKDMTAPYAGSSVNLSDSNTLFGIPLCQLIGDLLGVGAITDVCDLNLDGVLSAKVEATNGGSVSDAGLHAQRGILAGGVPVSGTTGTVHWPSPDQVVDNVFVQCGGNIGSDLSYALTDNSYDSRVSEAHAGLQLNLHFKGIAAAIPDLTIIDLSNLVNLLPGGPISVLAAGQDYQASIATLLAETTPPTIDALTAPASGLEGNAVEFKVTAHDNCPGALSYQWDFSDGGVAYGDDVFHTFADNGTYSYRVTVRDLRGNIAVSDPNITINNQDPIANAGPDATEAWGVAVPFNAQAVDPGSADQSTLSYQWDFGDNSPKGNAGNTTHTYTTPGVYTATLHVCDKDGACNDDSRTVTIRKRNTSTGYLGSHTWTYDTQVHLAGSLVDEFGQTVNARQLDFSIDGAPTTSGNTNSMGLADRTYQVTQTAGGHSVAAGFAGDALYNASSSSDNAVVVLKPTGVTYTGSLTGGPNKTITLSASLVDSEGKPLAGRNIDFVLGAQTVSATTDANGLASTSLKLNQKNGTYTLTTTFTPSGPDSSRYAGSGDSDTFKLQAK